MAPEQKAASKTRRLPCSASGGRCMGSGADSEGHPRPRGRQERRKGHFRGRLSRSMGGGGPASEERPLPSSRPPRREVMKPVPLPLDPPALGVSGTDDDDSWASSFTWRTSREIVRICFAAWNGLRAFSEDDSWASAHEWQSSRDTMRCFFSAWSVTRASIEAGKLGMLDTDVASLTGATPGIRSRDPPNSGSHRAAVVGVVSRPPLGQQRPGQELVDARKEKREPVLEVSSGFVSAVASAPPAAARHASVGTSRQMIASSGRMAAAMRCSTREGALDRHRREPAVGPALGVDAAGSAATREHPATQCCPDPLPPAAVATGAQ
eukprot:CAMPEP_0179074700 /NCGR_PEP_ID=MMETSP0796-20121207/33220_1 /TAXON_ID=73915 /ORGANISM="Pyrodinium bahamense, Strain pbaha01" /LENGTH=322 /DNA_ID=CAMNT_0020771929 /DNA_START=34 /DNA_END=1003 /DNA_ORIENTATION=+